MLRNRVMAGLVCLTLSGSGLFAQHAVSGAGHSAPSGPSRSFSRPAQQALANHSAPIGNAQIGRSGHWPSWNGTQAPNHHQPSRERYPYVYPGFLSYGYGYPLGYGFGAGDDSGDVSPIQQPAPGGEYGAPNPDAEMAETAPPLYRPPYQPSYQAPAALAPVHPQPATVLIFKDGRPQQEVHNYALLGSTLWNLDGDVRHEIPMDALDLPATVRANREAGVDFTVPASR